MIKPDKPQTTTDLYSLSTGDPVTSMTQFFSPADEYMNAFHDKNGDFIRYYTFDNTKIKKTTLNRGEFLHLALSAAKLIRDMGLKKGDRIIHAFSENSYHDLAFRLGSVFTGTVPVTINWQADDIERVIFKTRTTLASTIIYDSGFSPRIGELKPLLKNIQYLNAASIESTAPAAKSTDIPVNYSDEKMIVFTSGTTGNPRGAIIPHRSCLANRLTFESYFRLTEHDRVELLLVNPLHHSNSSAMSDWAMRRTGAVIHLVSKYTTQYWKILADTAEKKSGLLIAPLVSRHFDFLQSLIDEGKLPADREKIAAALGKTEILIGSAPVGPSTVNRIFKLSGRMPRVRFGSTETCLQVMAIPRHLSDDAILSAFEAGWEHSRCCIKIAGYYIGREHPPFTRVKIVKSISPDQENFMEECETGEPGYLITQGPNIMSGYAGGAVETNRVITDGWYSGLRDIAFYLINKSDGEKDYYWCSRESELLIRGGANYACEQVSAELKKFIIQEFDLKPEDIQIAVVGLRLHSEHEDACCVTIELNQRAEECRAGIAAYFIERACGSVSKGAKPDYVRFAAIPRNFKGAILYKELEQDYLDWINEST